MRLIRPKIAVISIFAIVIYPTVIVLSKAFVLSVLIVRLIGIMIVAFDPPVGLRGHYYDVSYCDNDVEISSPKLYEPIACLHRALHYFYSPFISRLGLFSLPLARLLRP